MDVNNENRDIRTETDADAWEAQGPASDHSFDCAIENVERVMKEYARLVVKARKLAIDLPYLRVCPFDHIIERWVEDRDDEGRVVGSRSVKVRVIRMAAGGLELRVKDAYTVVAAVDWLDGQPVIRTFPNKEISAEQVLNLQSDGPVCHHCCKIRARNQTFLLRPDEGHSLFQVGSTCLHDFTGIDPGYALLVAAFYQASETAHIGTRYETDLEWFLEWCALAVNRYGYVSRKQADAEWEETGRRLITTAEDAWALAQAARNNPAAPRPGHDEYALVLAVKDWVKTLQSDLSAYHSNLVSIFNSGILLPRHAGIVASAFGSYRREQERVAAAKARAAATRPSEYLGEVGQRITATFKVVGCHTSEGDFGTTWIYRLLTPQGDRATWFSSNDILEVGETVRLKGTIKKLELYRGEKGTVLTRCRRS